MRRVICLLLATGLISCSSLTMEAKRDFVDNTFYASNPSIAVKLAGTFIKVEEKKDNTFAFFSNAGLSGGVLDIENYRFYDRTRFIEVLIRIKRLNRGYWRANLNEGIPHPLEVGKVVQSGREYHYSIFAIKTPQENNLMIKRFARCSGAKSQTLIEYFYFRHIGSSLGDFRKWQDPKTLTKEQITFLSQFISDCDKDLRFIEFSIPLQQKI